MHKTQFTKDKALSFLLTYIIIEQSTALQLDQLMLFTLSNLAQQAADTINSGDDVVPHEAIEAIANNFLDNL
jgi:hypothetical protein